MNSSKVLFTSCWMRKTKKNNEIYRKRVKRNGKKWMDGRSRNEIAFVFWKDQIESQPNVIRMGKEIFSSMFPSQKKRGA